jgi:hypothetical protein
VVGVLVVLALLITPQLRAWWLQQRRLGELRAAVAASQRDVTELRAERERWNDPSYVRAQARERLHFVLPGETGFTITGGTQQPGSSGGGGTAGGQGAATARPWFGDLWKSVQVAGHPPAAQTPSP